MTRTISERLSVAAESSFVGRREELTLFSEAIEADQLPFVVAFIHGPGGIGKSSLLQAALNSVSSEVQAIVLDCRQMEPTAKGFLSAVGDALGIQDPDPPMRSVAEQLGGSSQRTLLALDTYETFGLMDTWLRQEFIPALPETVLTIIAGREPPNAAWLTTPGWQGLFHEIELGELADDDASRMLASRGLTEPQLKRVNRFARGHPLALELAAAALRTQPGLELTGGPPPKVMHQLTDAFLTGLPPGVMEAVEAASTTRRLTEPILRALLAASDARESFDKLQEIPFVDATDEGLVFHDVVREAVANALAQRDPERYRGYRRRAWRFLASESHRAVARNLWQCTADLLYLIGNPAVRDAFFPRGANDYALEPATARDGEAIRDIATSTEADESARLLVQWWERHPETFSVARGRDGAVAAFYMIFEPANVDQRSLAQDPLTAAWLRHVSENPVAEGERVLFLRRWLACATGEAPSPAQGACWLDIKRTYMELRPHLRRLYTTVADLATYTPIMVPLGFAPLEQANVDLGGVTYHTAVLDFGERSVDGWLARLIGAELGVGSGEEEAELPEGTLTILFTDIADSTRLTEELGDAAFRARARDLDLLLRDVISEAGGRAVEGKLLGDGVMAVFSLAHQAIECSLRCNKAAEDAKLGLHLGLHAGDVIREGDNVFGGAVNIAARICAASAPGEILVSETVRSLARTSAGVAFEDSGQHALKGVADAQRLFAVKASREQ